MTTTSPNNTMKSVRKMRKSELLTEAKDMRSMLVSQDTLISQAPVPDLKSLAADFAVLKAMLESVVDNNDMLKRKIKSFELINDDRIRTLELSLDHLDQYLTTFPRMLSGVR